MIEFKWIITNEFIGCKANENYSKEDFLYTDGYFEMTLNQRKWGVFPKIAENWNGTFVKDFPSGGDSLMELFQCFSRILSLRPNQQYLFQPMDMPLIKLLFCRESDALQISQQRDEKEISRI